MSYHAMIIGSNGYKTSTNSSSNLGKRVREYNSDRKTITSVAVGPSYQYEVCCNTGAAWYNGPSGFESRMKSIDCSNVKHITFGPDDYNEEWMVLL